MQIIPFPRPSRVPGAIAPTLSPVAKAFLEHLRNDHLACACYGLNVICCTAQHKAERGLKVLALGGSIDDALAAAGPFGVRGSVEVSL